MNTHTYFTWRNFFPYKLYMVETQLLFLFSWLHVLTTFLWSLNLIYKMFYLHLTSFILYNISAYEIYSNIIIVLHRYTKWYNLIHPLGKNMRRYINLILYHNIEKIPIQILWHGLSQNYFFLFPHLTSA